MSNCCPPCVEEYAGTNREKWEYVASIYFPGVLQSSESVIAAAFQEDWDAYQASGTDAIFEKWLQWKYEVGTDTYGNLPQHRKSEHVGHCFAPCPYSSDCDDVRTRHMLGLDDADPLPTRVSHTSGNMTYYMQTANRGSKWGYECTFINCSFPDLDFENGIVYFYT